MSLCDLYHSYHYFVTEESGCLLVGFREDSVTFIVKEVWNKEPVGLPEVDRLYTEMQRIGEMCGCNQFRILAHGGYLPEALSFELHGLTVSDESYLRSLETGKHIELFSHNEAAYRAIEEGFKTNRIGAVVQATGTGKSYLIARYIVNHSEDDILVIAPNVTIIAEIKKAIGRTMPHVAYRTFQALVLNRGTVDELKANHIIIDEFHHFGAEVWGKAVQEVIDNNPEARVLGMSATPIRPEEMLDTVEVYFKGNLFHELSLSMAWYYKILPVPVLVQSVFDLNNQLDKVQRMLNRSDCTSERRKRIQDKIDFARLDFRGSLSASELIRRYLPKEVKKMLVFCKDKEDLQHMIPSVAGTWRHPLLPHAILRSAYLWRKGHAVFLFPYGNNAMSFHSLGYSARYESRMFPFQSQPARASSILRESYAEGPPCLYRKQAFSLLLSADNVGSVPMHSMSRESRDGQSLSCLEYACAFQMYSRSCSAYAVPYPAGYSDRTRSAPKPEQAVSYNTKP